MPFDMSRAQVSGPREPEIMTDLGQQIFKQNTWRAVGYDLPETGSIALCLTDGDGDGSIGPFVPVSVIRGTTAQVDDVAYNSSSVAGLQLYRGWLLKTGTGANTNAVVRIGRTQDDELLVGINAAINGSHVVIVHHP